MSLIDDVNEAKSKGYDISPKGNCKKCYGTGISGRLLVDGKGNKIDGGRDILCSCVIKKIGLLSFDARKELFGVKTDEKKNEVSDQG